jgi:hypothetical protein
MKRVVSCWFRPLMVLLRSSHRMSALERLTNKNWVGCDSVQEDDIPTMRPKATPARSCADSVLCSTQV